MDKNVFTIGLGGAAGEGVKKAGIKIADFLRQRGYEVYISFEYPSLIRGGHNFVRLTFGKEKIWNDHSQLDMLIASNEDHANLHRGELKEGGKIVTDIPLPKISENPELVLNEEVSRTPLDTKTELLDGNTAFAKGLQAAGLQFYFAYPMTPSTSILHYLASKSHSAEASRDKQKEELRVIQPENEIAVINMALGAAYAGKRAAVGTATGGFALMQEAFSFAGIAELPLVVAVSQRQAPATGVPTHSSQSDLRFAIHAGHGEFPRIVMAPGDPAEAYCAGAEALNLAWKFQIPVIVLLDKILSEHMTTVPADQGAVAIERGKIAENPAENYNRYQITSDGISPLAFPGTAGATVKITSYEHDERGITTEKANEVKEMSDKRFAKSSAIAAEMKNRETVKVFGDTASPDAIVCWGSTKGAVLEAVKSSAKPVKIVQILWLEPFDAEKVRSELQGKNIICVEGNHSGQLASLIRERTGLEIAKKILKYDSRPFDADELTNELTNCYEQK